MLESVILDMDGTLLDTERLSLTAWQRICAEYGYNIPTEFIIGFFGMSRAAIAQLFLDTFGPDFPIKEIYAERNTEGLRMAGNDPVPVKPGAIELLEHLRAHGIPAVVATSTNLDRAAALLTRGGITPYLADIVTGDMVERSKPEPDIFLEAARRAGADPKRSLVVEDSGNGARAGLAAGARVVVVPDLKEPDEEIVPRLYRVCPSLLEVIDVVEELRNT